MKENHMNNRHTDELLELVRQNPDLPIVAMVDSDVVCGGDYGWWLGSITHSRVTEYAIDTFYGDGEVKFKDDHGTEEYLVEAIAETRYSGTDDDYTQAAEDVKKLWRKAIVAYVSPHEEDTHE